MDQKILSDKGLNERMNAYSHYLGGRNISVLPLNVYDPRNVYRLHKKNRKT